MVVLAMLYTRTFYGLTHLFHRLKIPPSLQAGRRRACSAALLGLGLYYLFGHDPQVLAVLSFGYGILQDAMTLRPTPGEPVASRWSCGCRVGQDPDHRPDDRQRRLGRRLRPVDGHRRLRRRGARDLALHWTSATVARAASGHLRHRRHGGLLRRSRQDPVFDAGDRQRNDRQLRPAAADAVGLRHHVSCSPTNNRSTVRKSKAVRVRRPTRGITFAKC